MRVSVESPVSFTLWGWVVASKTPEGRRPPAVVGSGVLRPRRSQTLIRVAGVGGYVWSVFFALMSALCVFDGWIFQDDSLLGLTTS